MLLWLNGRGRSEDEMPAKPKQPLDAIAIGLHLSRLQATTYDFESFKKVYAALENDASMTASDVIELARQFAKARARSRKAAMLAIGQERARLAHSRSKAQSAAR